MENKLEEISEKLSEIRENLSEEEWIKFVDKLGMNIFSSFEIKYTPLIKNTK